MLSLPEMQNNYIQVLFSEHYTFEQSIDTFDNFENAISLYASVLIMS